MHLMQMPGIERRALVATRAWLLVAVSCLFAMLGGTGLSTAAPLSQEAEGQADESAQSVETETAEQPLPLIDLHFHPDSRWNLDALVAVFDAVGVTKAGNGSISARDDRVGLQFVGRYPDRFVPFAGQIPLRDLIAAEGQRAWNLQSEAVNRYIAELEGALRSGSFHGIGEIFANNLRSHPATVPALRFPADSPLMRRLWAFSAELGIPLSVHMEATQDSVAEMERLLATDRAGTWIWAHTGFSAEPPLLRQLLEKHPNLFCELSYRETSSRNRLTVPIDDGVALRPEWVALLEEFSDRFVIGTDLSDPSLAGYAALIARWRTLLDPLSPEAAANIAHGNATRLLERPRLRSGEDLP